MKIIITGATGMVGSEVVNQALQDDTIEQVTVIVRKPPSIRHPKLTVVIHKDFMDYSGLESIFRRNEGCIWCLGISQNQVSEKEYVKITYDYAVAAATAMLAANPSISFLFLSGHGAQQSEQSRVLFGRIKGRTENALMKMAFKRLLIARPAGILPVNNTASYPFVLKMQYLMVRMFRYITPSYVITSVKLAKALLYIMKYGNNQTIFTYKDINEIARSLR
jgi:uncharacterized protein YbjT (DUF2867 family)